MSKPRHTRADRIQAGAAPGYAPKGAPDPERPDAPSPLRSLGLEGDKLLLYQLNLVQKTLAELRKKSDPTTYGLPDLLRPQTPEETPEAFLLRQNSELREFIQTKLKVTKAGKTRPIIVNREMLTAVADLFYGRVKKAIWWKPRGGGGSLGAALIIWLRMVYHRTSFVDVAGALEQAKNVFEYVKDFWTNFPEMAQKLLDGDPTTSQIKLVNGTYLRCITNSEKAGRGKHPPALVCDEACQRDTKSDTGFEAAMNTVLSEPDPIVLLLSTFHHPTGLFASYWDHAEEKGFTRYKWDCFSIMAPCTEPIECSACPLTWTVEKRDIEGNTILETQGCNGKARTSDGFQTYKATREAQLQNYGTDVFPVEFAGVRPDFRSKVIEDEWVEAAKIEEAEWAPGCTVAVGIDWGLTGQTALILTVHRGEDVCVVDSVFVSGVLVSGVITHLEAWWEALGPFEVYADGSHNYNNLELEQAGFPVVRVFFKKHKRTAYGNLVAYMVHRRLRILADQTTLLGQLRDLKRDKNGDIKKVNDHGPDALVCALLRFLFVQYYPGDLPAELLEELEGTGEAMSF